jgi:hypothetical protein
MRATSSADRHPPETLARVTASDLLGSEGGQPIGNALAGPLGTAIGAHTYLTHSTAAFGRCARSRLGYPSCLG